MNIVFPAGERVALIPLRCIGGSVPVIPPEFDARCATGVNIALSRKCAYGTSSAEWRCRCVARSRKICGQTFLPPLFLYSEQLRSDEGVDPLAADYKRFARSLPRFPVAALVMGDRWKDNFAK